MPLLRFTSINFLLVSATTAQRLRTAHVERTSDTGVFSFTRLL